MLRAGREPRRHPRRKRDHRDRRTPPRPRPVGLGSSRRRGRGGGGGSGGRRGRGTTGGSVGQLGSLGHAMPRGPILAPMPRAQRTALGDARARRARPARLQPTQRPPRLDAAQALARGAVDGDDHADDGGRAAPRKREPDAGGHLADAAHRGPVLPR